MLKVKKLPLPHSFAQCNIFLAVSDTSRKVRDGLQFDKSHDVSEVHASHSSFQQAVLRNVNERNAQMQKQLENVVREGE